jgi:hypothetical protein
MTDFITLDDTALACAFGGQGQAKNPEELRPLAKQYCPVTAQRYQHSPITRPIAERCLEEAGLGGFKGRLDAYFPKKR